MTGPSGSAFLRPKHSGRLVLVASGTGFAPMWSVAVAAIMERPQREIVFVVAARRLQSLYMHGALCRLALFPNVTIILTTSEPQRVSPAIRIGRPTDHLPELSPNDLDLCRRCAGHDRERGTDGKDRGCQMSCRPLRAERQHVRTGRSKALSAEGGAGGLVSALSKGTGCVTEARQKVWDSIQSD